MFGRTPKVAVSKLDEAIVRILDDMEMYGPTAEEYPTLISHLERINTLRKSHDARRPTPDAMLMVAGNLFGILIIVAYEQKHVWLSKALPVALKSK